MNNRQIILSSTSKPRQLLLERLQIQFKVAAPNIDETPLENEKPEALALRLAKEKALAVAKQFPDALIIGSDQVCILENKIFGKPLNYETAVKQLQAASGKRVQFVTGLCLFDSRTQIEMLELETFFVIYRHLSLAQIENYLKKEQPYQCSGSCKSEGLGIALIEAFEGRDFTSLIGLPLIRLVGMLEKAGVNPLALN